MKNVRCCSHLQGSLDTPSTLPPPPGPPPHPRTPHHLGTLGRGAWERRISTARIPRHEPQAQPAAPHLNIHKGDRLVSCRGVAVPRFHHAQRSRRGEGAPAQHCSGRGCALDWMRPTSGCGLKCGLPVRAAVRRLPIAHGRDSPSSQTRCRASPSIDPAPLPAPKQLLCLKKRAPPSSSSSTVGDTAQPA